MSRIAVTGAAGPVGRRVCARLLEDPEVSTVLALDRDPVAGLLERSDGRLEHHRIHLRDGDLDAVFARVDTVCHLAGSDPLEGTAVDHDLHTIARVLAAVERTGVGHVIVRTSAAVYGAWPENPVPLTEADPRRPNPDSPWVQIRAEVEDRLDAFALAHPEVRVAVLRPCVTVSEDGPDELGRVLAAARVTTSAEDGPPCQFVHADDVASAVDIVRRQAASGAYNVAPDGALDADRVGALVGGSPHLGLDEDAAKRVTKIWWRFRVAPTPPGFVPFVSAPWVVANDRLKDLGWTPTSSNDEAFVAGHAAAPWAQITPKRRQELALGVAGAVLTGAIVTGGILVRRGLRR